MPYKRNKTPRKSPGVDKKTTSWEGVSKWYTDHVQGEDTYHKQVVEPQLLKLLAPQAGEHILDLACGEGYFARAIAKSGAHVTGVDISTSLIEHARAQSADIEYHVSSADSIPFLSPASFDAVTCVLALQNIEKFREAIRECARTIKRGGRLVLVLNHPAFRIPKRSSWDFDEKEYLQFRRIDAYLSEATIKIDMTPGTKSEKAKEYTYSFHRPLSVYIRTLSEVGFAVTHCDEWISHRESEPGPRAKAENKARREFPLFLAIRATK